LVEDDGPLRRVLAETLEIYGYEVVVAASAKDAAAKLASERISVVVSDLHLHGNGMVLVSTGQAGDVEVPVILISADSRPETSRRAGKLGASRFLVKPVTGQELHDAIEEVCPGQMATRS
jgi:DNA-binding NtrC family response regulator